MLNAITAPLDQRRWAVSRRVRESMWHFVAAKSEILVQGIELDRFVPTDGARERVRQELGIPDDAVVAVTVANLRREKDYPNLLRASRSAFDAVPNLVVLAMGQGPLKEDIERLHDELGLGERFRLLGFRADVADVMAAADLFVVASAHEGGPLSLFEAMRSGLPTVATDVGFVSDVMCSEVHGLIVPPSDQAALAHGLTTLARDPQLRLLMSHAALEASGLFDVRRAIRRQVEAYRELAIKPETKKSTR